MSRIATVIILILVMAFSFFAYYNPGSVTLRFWKGEVIELPVIGVVLFSMGVGALVVFALFAIRGLRKTFVQVQESMKNRRRVKAEDLYNKGVDAHLSGKVDRAAKLLEEAVEKDLDFLLPVFRLGTVYLSQGKIEEAIELHEKAREAHPKNLRVKFFLVDDYIAAGKPAEAQEVLEQIIKRDDSNRTALETLRKIQEKEGDWEGAVSTQRKVIKLKDRTDDEQAYLTGLKYQFAVDLVEKGEYDRALKLLKEIMKESPSFVAAIVSQGEAHIAMGKLDEGLKLLENGYGEHKKSVFLQVMEDKLMELENPRKLIEIYKGLLNKYPDDVFLNLFYSKTCLRLEMIDEGLMALKKVESLGYDSPLLHVLLGEFMTRRDRIEDAVSEYKKFVNITFGLKPQYQCGECGHMERKWSARCGSCRNWNTLTLPELPEAAVTPADAPRYEDQG